MYTGGALMFMLDGCGYTDNSGGGGGHYWDLDPVLTPLLSSVSVSFSNFKYKCWYANIERNVDTLKLLVKPSSGK